MMIELQVEVLEFATTMQKKLNQNKNKACAQMNIDGKGRTWKNCELVWLLRRLREETIELEIALYDTDADGMMNEAADVGNFAMMIHDHALIAKEQADDKHMA